MATQAEIDKDKELLQGLGLPVVKIWPPRCAWTTKDGELRPNLPCDPYSRHLWMSKGMTPNLFDTKTKEGAPTKVEYITHGTVDKTNLLGAIELLISEKGVWEGTVSELREELRARCHDLPVNATRLGRAIRKLVSQLFRVGITVHWVKTAQRRAIRLERH